jgi:hypothetical protein
MSPLLIYSFKFMLELPKALETDLSLYWFYRFCEQLTIEIYVSSQKAGTLRNWWSKPQAAVVLNFLGPQADFIKRQIVERFLSMFVHLFLMNALLMKASGLLVSLVLAMTILERHHLFERLTNNRRADPEP